MKNQVFSFQNTVNVATCLSGFHKLVLTVLKTSFSKNKPKKISYRDYNIFYGELHHSAAAGNFLGLPYFCWLHDQPPPCYKVKVWEWSWKIWGRALNVRNGADGQSP